MNLKQKIVSGTAAGTMLLSVLSPAAFANSFEISNNGRNSDNRIEYSQRNSLRINQSNEANVNNSVNISSNTGGNEARDNRNVRIRTGNSNSHVEIANHLNSNHLSISHHGGSNDNGNNGNGNGNGDDNGQGGGNEIERLMTHLVGEEEVPGPGDPDGKGKAKIRLNLTDGELCSVLKVKKIDTPTAAHIHHAPVGESGPVVVTLPTPTDGHSEGCMDVEDDLLMDIKENPHEYYVNVHNDEYPEGAIRGQL